MPKQWNYLASEPFQLRYMVAAGLLRKFENILEIGSYKTPIFQFIDQEDKNIISIDPMIFETRKSKNQGSRCLDYRSLEIDIFGGLPYALVILGLDLPITYKLKMFIAEAELAVVEYPEDNQLKK